MAPQTRIPSQNETVRKTVTKATGKNTLQEFSTADSEQRRHPGGAPERVLALGRRAIAVIAPSESSHQFVPTVPSPTQPRIISLCPSCL